MRSKYTRGGREKEGQEETHTVSVGVWGLLLSKRPPWPVSQLLCSSAELLQDQCLSFTAAPDQFEQKKKPSHFKASLDHRDQVRRKKNMKRETKGQAQRILGTHSLSHLSNRYLEVFLVEVTPRLRALQQQTCSSDSPVIRRSHDWFPSSKSYKSVFLIWLLKCQDSQIWTLKLFYVEKYMASQISQLCWWP